MTEKSQKALAIPAGGTSEDVIVRGSSTSFAIENIDSVAYYGILGNEVGHELKHRHMRRHDWVLALTDEGIERLTDAEVGWIDLPLPEGADAFTNPDREACIFADTVPKGTRTVVVLAEHHPADGPVRVEATLLSVES